MNLTYIHGLEADLPIFPCISSMFLYPSPIFCYSFYSANEFLPGLNKMTIFHILYRHYYNIPDCCQH